MTKRTISAERTQGPGSRRLARLILAAGIALLGMPLFAGPSLADDFSNTTPINVPLSGIPAGCPPVCPPDTANPYPSNIPVAGLTGTVTDINVTLRDLTWRESGPSDADIMVVAPDGKAVMIMSDACGDNTNVNVIGTPITLSFDDQAGGPLPADTACSTATVQPLDDDDDAGEFTGPPPPRQPDVFPAPAPAAPATTLPLSTFNGIAPNGTWSLYVMDDMPNTPAQADSGRIAGGWTLSVATTTTAATTTTTAAATTTTTAAATTTTTAAATTTTTRAAAIAAATTTTVRPAVRSTAATLPRTGSSLNRSTVLGAALVAVGLGLIRLGRPKKRAMYNVVTWR